MTTICPVTGSAATEQQASSVPIAILPKGGDAMAADRARRIHLVDMVIATAAAKDEEAKVAVRHEVGVMPHSQLGETRRR